MGSILLSAVCVVVFVNAQVNCGDIIPVRKCATLYSDINFDGSTFSLIDFDQSVNLVKEYRHSLNGWNRTGSIRVEKGCSLEMCSDTYFAGKCEIITGSSIPSLHVSTGVKSVECTCQRKCSCSDIHVPRDYSVEGPVARAYLEGGCDTCNNDYLPLFQGDKIYVEAFPKEYGSRVTAFVVADGCVVFISYIGELQGPVIKVNLTNQKDPTIYARCIKGPRHEMPFQETNLLRLPATINKLYEFVQSKTYSAAHLGIQAALKSAENGRSGANVYIVYFIDIELAAQPYWIGFSVCGNGPKEAEIIWECNILVPLHDLRISTELRLIVVPINYLVDPAGSKLMEALEKHLSAIEDLDNAIPNAVIIQDDGYADPRSFGRKLKIVLAMSPRLLDVSNPNIIFLLNKYNRDPDKEILEREIRKTWSFPFVICVAPYPYNSYFQPKLYIHRNGYQRMINMEYWPRNLEMSLNYVCERGGDPLGRETLKAYFQDSITLRSSVKAKPSTFG